MLAKGRHKATFQAATHYVKKRVKYQSSKPLFGWLQKKLGGTIRASTQDTRRPTERPRAVTLQQLEIPPRHSDSGPVVLIDDEVSHLGRSTYPRSSRSSTWSPSQPEAADDDASIRPLPPTSPPSPAPSRSSSSYLSDPRTFKSVTASTKPTTLISIDLGTNGMAHIAQAPPTPISSNPSSALPRFSTSSISVSNSTSITFSALPPTSPGVRSEQSGSQSVQAPLHTSHHPRYNPRPSSPPQDNASMLTLASSAFGFPGGRMGGWVGGDSQSQLTASHQDGQEGEIEDGQIEDGQTEDASVIALRPRSSRRNSWESEASGWSARPFTRSLHGTSFKVTDGDGSAELTGEDSENLDNKCNLGPSPLSEHAPLGNRAVGESEDEHTRVPVKGLVKPSEGYTKEEMQPMVKEIGEEGDVTEKLPLLSAAVGDSPDEARTLSDEAKARF